MTLLDKVKFNFVSRGYTVINLSISNDCFRIGNIDVGNCYIDVCPTFRHNGSPCDVTVTLSIIYRVNKYCGRYLCKLKVPKNASDKVINNRVEKAIFIMDKGV